MPTISYLKLHAVLAQARTVLITSVPLDLCDKHELRLWASFVPGGVENIWIYRDTTELNQDYNNHLKACAKLEKTTFKLIRSVIKSKAKHNKADNSAHKKEVKAEMKNKGGRDKEMVKAKQTDNPRMSNKVQVPLGIQVILSSLRTPLSGHSVSRLSPNARGETGQRLRLFWSSTRRLGKGLTTGWDSWVGLERKLIQSSGARLNKSIDKKQPTLLHGETKPRLLGSAFIQCNLQMGAHVLAQCVSHHQPLAMLEKWYEVSPKDVIWDNIDVCLSSCPGTIVLIIVWFAPVAFVGTFNNVSALCKKVLWLCWINNVPTPFPGIIQEVQTFLIDYTPYATQADNEVVRSGLCYFLFLVMFLIVTLSSGLTNTATQIIENPTSAISDLVIQLPGTSIFFSPGREVCFCNWFLGRTPRQAYGVTFLMPKADFGLVMPQMLLLATIALDYSVLSLIINALATLLFMLFFFSWLTWVFDQPDEFDTGGKYFPIAINFTCT
ncbi:hypothetical protein BC835DRAFT_1305678 [Cytidiella melzeri]|nr:hypothetical protein BC835DRAFT_1305678 [Cytidiella melzeri]